MVPGDVALGVAGLVRADVGNLEFAGGLRGRVHLFTANVRLSTTTDDDATLVAFGVGVVGSARYPLTRQLGLVANLGFEGILGRSALVFVTRPGPTPAAARLTMGVGLSWNFSAADSTNPAGGGP
jgi:hypothetical protein